MYSNNVDSIETILGFIDRFTANGKRKEVIDTFSNGCCYWFANILYNRFMLDSRCAIMYDQVANHFGCLINNVVYDITGMVTHDYSWEPWRDIHEKDPLLFERIVRDCIDMKEAD